MKLLAGLAFASLAAAVPVMDKRASIGLDVELKMQGNSKVKAVITNNGKNSLKVLKSGTFLDTSAVEKAQVFSANGIVPFDGVRVNLHMESLTDAAFQRIPSGQSIEVDFDIAELHDLSSGGKYGILSSGALSFADDNSTNLIGSVPFHSNMIEAEVDGVQAYEVKTAFSKKRSVVQTDCTGDKLTATYSALGRCAGLAQAAQLAAQSGSDAKMVEYFKSASAETRSTVAGVYSRIATECGSTTAGDAKFYCTDVYGACSDGVLAYTVPGLNYMAYCDLFFTALQTETTTCHGQEQGTTVVHETTHLSQVKGTSDYGGYGYDFLRSLTAAEDINHADTYALFANAINLGC
ncbi:hypothetical protein G7Z17_g10740 [Cylindrodendrum hubeiense]|uniref:Neutral protease 2 n=1 Tax=Cylindrodendrum hubeiense TaxID=595255 RepID=A0A9P5L4J4_9HYPO|nr:hypothetical protein G7Z17_g10740 [Cylindrodendrum hubeiense]